MSEEIKQAFLTKRSEINTYLRDEWDNWDEEVVYTDLLSLYNIIQSTTDKEFQSWMRDKYMILVQYYYCSSMHNISKRVQAEVDKLKK